MKIRSIAASVCILAANLGAEHSVNRVVVGEWIGSIPNTAVDASQAVVEGSIRIRFSFRTDGGFAVVAGEKKLAGKFEITRAENQTYLWLRYEKGAGVSARLMLPNVDTMRLENIVLVASDPKPTVLILRREK